MVQQHSSHHQGGAHSGSTTTAVTAILTRWAPLCRQLAPLSSIAFYVAPLATVRRLRREHRNRTKGAGAAETVPPLLPYTTMVLSNGLWVAYGTLRREPSILLANGTGLLLGCGYFASYLQVFFFGGQQQQQQQQRPTSSSSSYLPEKQQQQSTASSFSSLLPGTVAQHVQSIACMLVFVCLLIVGGESETPNQEQQQKQQQPQQPSLLLPFRIPPYDAARALGTVGVVLSIAMFASPLVALKTVIRTGNAQSLSTATIAATVVSNALWCVAGLYELRDKHIAWQGAIGLAAGVVQLLVKLWYSSSHSGPRRAMLRLVGGRKRKKHSILKRSHSMGKSSERNSSDTMNDENDNNSVGVLSPIVELVPPAHHTDDLHTRNKERTKAASKRHAPPAVKEILYV